MLVAELLAAWTTATLPACKTANSGTLNQTFLCETSAGHYVLKRYSFTGSRRVEREHELINYAYEQGLPAIVPLYTLAGGDILEHAGLYCGRMMDVQPIERENLQKEVFAHVALTTSEP